MTCLLQTIVQLLYGFLAFRLYWMYIVVSVPHSKLKKSRLRRDLNIGIGSGWKTVVLFFIAVFARNGQFMTSFFSAAGQNLTAIGCFHAFAKTMNCFSATLMRLIGSFFTWHCIKFFPAFDLAGFYKLISWYILHSAGHHPCCLWKDGKGKGKQAMESYEIDAFSRL